MYVKTTTLVAERPRKGKRLLWVPSKDAQPLRLGNPSEGIKVSKEDLEKMRRLGPASLIL